jgi:N utilization substance protein A
MRIKFNTDSMAYIALFESSTGAHVKDCLVEEGKLVFVVEEGHAGLAIGKNGINVKKLQNATTRQIEILEFSKDPVKFVANIFRPLNIKGGYVSERSDGMKVLHVIAPKNRMLAKVKIKKVKSLVPKYFKIDSVEFS